jgi:hypothetical protein
MERVDYESLLISELLQDRKSEALEVAPWYQRRSVWKNPQKAYLINTIFEGKPIPSIYVRHVIDLDDEKSVKEIVDGQQRVRSVLEYRDGLFAAKHPEHDNKYIKYADLSKAQRQRFLSSKLSVGYLIGADDSDVIEIFGRINSIAKTLNPQEKRNASFSGEFKQFALNRSVELLPFWRSTKIFSDTDISRMLEVQAVSDILYNMLEGLKDFSASAITKTYKKHDETFAEADEIHERWKAVVRLLVAQDPSVISGSIFSAYQIFHSLFVFLDRTRANKWTKASLKSLIQSADLEISSLGEREQLSDAERTLLAAFKGGNLHRIRARKRRDEFLESTAAKI